MFYSSSDDSDDTIHNGFDEDQMEVKAKLLQNTNVTAEERFSVDFNAHEKLTLSAREESDSLMELESDISRIEPAISASVEGNIPEIKRKLQEKIEEIYQNQEETPEANVTGFIVTVEKLIKLQTIIFVVKYLSGILKDLYFYCNRSAQTIIMGIGTQVKFYAQEEATRFTPSI